MTIANRLTLARIMMVPVIFVAYYLPFSFADVLAAVLFVLAALTDLFDGALARKRNEITSFGKFADPIADKLLVAAMLLALCGDGRIHAAIVFAIIAREFIVSGIRLVAVSSNAQNVIAASWLGKIKTIIQIVTIVVLLLDNWPFSLINLPMDQILIWLMLAFTLWSGADYVVKYWGTIGETK
jgi:CDP-diacylglycerol--glycerol-3-phosphate 3-phosphatidyltransferase